MLLIQSHVLFDVRSDVCSIVPDFFFRSHACCSAHPTHPRDCPDASQHASSATIHAVACAAARDCHPLHCCCCHAAPPSVPRCVSPSNRSSTAGCVLAACSFYHRCNPGCILLLCICCRLDVSIASATVFGPPSTLPCVPNTSSTHRRHTVGISQHRPRSSCHVQQSSQVDLFTTCSQHVALTDSLFLVSLTCRGVHPQHRGACDYETGARLAAQTRDVQAQAQAQTRRGLLQRRPQQASASSGRKLPRVSVNREGHKPCSDNNYRSIDSIQLFGLTAQFSVPHGRTHRGRGRIAQHVSTVQHQAAKGQARLRLKPRPKANTHVEVTDRKR